MKKAKTIFYLDDDLEDLDFFKEITEDLGHTVIVYADGRKMLLALEIQIDRPDIIFLDIHMPILNGEEILETIKKSEHLKDIPVVMVSGAYSKKMTNHYSNLDVRCLVKKHNFMEFKTAIEQVLDEYINKDGGIIKPQIH